MRHLYPFILALALVAFCHGKAFSQSIAIKSNALYLLTGTLNAGGEIRCGDHYSLQLNLHYNPWDWGENKKMKHFLIQPECRYWFDETFFGSFIGLQAHFTQYNFGSTTPFRTIKNNRYQGNMIGCGVTYGYQWLLNAFWSIEASISVGYAHLEYDKYGPIKGDELIKHAHSNYWGPTQVGISFVYFIQ